MDPLRFGRPKSRGFIRGSGPLDTGDIDEQIAVTAGHTTREIARRLKLSAKTVESHRGEVMKRLGMHDVVALVRFAIRVGLVPPEM
ncbi:MAG: response regulator transcription factor [Gemmatimonadales bacterium]